ncbi:MAG: nucleoside hydrolase [Ilumatobacteraceae bacterium]
MAPTASTISLLPRSDGPVRVVIDTDAANEIDDQFALAWALLAADRLHIEAITAAPFAHGPYLANLVAAQALRGEQPATAFEGLAADLGAETIEGLIAHAPPALGMERSHAEILRVLDAAMLQAPPPVHRGAAQFLERPDRAVESEAARAIIDLVHASDEPLFVAVLGAPTNVASALLLDPSIADRLVVVFVAGYPTSSVHVDDSFNLLQDRHASNRLLADDVNLVYIPGYQVADTLSVSLPDLERHVEPCGPLGALLTQLYRDNPLAAEPLVPGHSWVMWDLAPIAWLIDPTWVLTHSTTRATIGSDHRWHAAPGELVEGFRADRRAIYIDLYRRLAAGT